MRLSFAGFVVFLLSQSSLFAQTSPGGVSNQSVWVQNGRNMPVSNYHSIDLSRTFQNADIDDYSFNQSSTLFVVLKPRSASANGTLYLRLGDIRIYDDHLEYARESINYSFTEGRPCIVAFEVQRSSRYGLRRWQRIELGDSSLFSLAELVVYPEILSREDRRKVSSNLAIKYAIPITYNQDQSWRSYWNRNGAHYWNSVIDRLYDQRVMALGRSDAEDFHQTQTISETGDELWLGLNSFQQVGTMPNAQVDDESFVVFSERLKDQSFSAFCPGQEQQQHPLFKWKFQLQNWNSVESNLLVRIKIGKAQRDSLFITDGQYRAYVPEQLDSGDFVSYLIDLTPLSNGVHYFFEGVEQFNCDSISLSTTTNSLSVRLPSDSVLLEIQSLNTGYSEYHQWRSGSFQGNLPSGQYLVSGRELDSSLLFARVIRIGESNQSEIENASEYVKIRLYPNPNLVDQLTFIEVENLPLTEHVTLMVSDAQGRLLVSQQMDYQELIKGEFRAPTPGLYTVTILQGESIYAQKLIISTDQ